MGARSAGNPHAALRRGGGWKRGMVGMPRPTGAPVLDPTCERPGVKFPRPTHPYVPTAAGFLYLAVVLDAFSCRIVGWAMETHPRTELVLAALEMAIGQRKPSNVIHHSDQGTQAECRDRSGGSLPAPDVAA